MLAFKKVLCPTDFSEPSYEALDTACEMALHFDAELCLVHVVPHAHPIMPISPFAGYVPLDMADYERVMCDNAQRELCSLVTQRVPSKVKASMIVRVGNPAEEIARAAETEDADLIVVATHGLTGWRHRVVGSVAEKVLHLAHCPVLISRTTSPEA